MEHNEQFALRTRKIIEHLEEVWRHSYQPSSETLKRITEFVLSLPEQYQAIGLQIIAKHTVDNMSLHMLDLLGTYQQNAEQEGISAEDREKALGHIIPEVSRTLAALQESVSVRSLDDLAALINITSRLQILSQSDTAEEAQSWLYELPTRYYRKLATEGLVIDVRNSESKLSQPGGSGFLVTEGLVLTTMRLRLPTQKTLTSTPSLTSLESSDVHLSSVA